MKKLLISPKAELDLDSIWLFIAQDSVENADKFLDRLYQSFTLLKEYPLIGADRAELADSLRSFPVADYILFYISRPGKIEVVRVLHSARDVTALFDQHGA